jgi:hypothetical protein
MNKQFYSKVEEIEKATKCLINHYYKDFHEHLKNEDQLKEIDLVDTDKLLEEINDEPGIYYFEASFQPMAETITFQEFHEEFTNKWNELEGTYKSPKFYKKNAEYHFNKIREGKWVPFYIGKRKKIKNRIMEHILGPKSNGTYAMRLKNRNLKLKYRMNYITLKSLETDQYYIVEHFEKELRKQIRPIIGKQ